MMSRFPILMYHNVCEDQNKGRGLTIAIKSLEAQFKFLVENGYETYHFSQLESIMHQDSLSKKSVIITFDDVYLNQLKYAYPLLKKYNLKASFFIPFKYVNQFDLWNTNSEPIMSVEQLKSLDTNIIELGLHSYHHEKYNELSESAIIEDFKLCQAFIKENDLQVENVLAYPYGKFPRKEPKKSAFFKVLKHFDIAYGLRIGNRVNRFPFKNNYLVQRIDIKGEDSLLQFKLKLRFGKLKLF